MMREISWVQVRLVVMGSCAAAVKTAARASPMVLIIRTLCRFLFLGEDQLGIHTGVEGHTEEPDHHLLPALIAPANLLGRVGIVRVVFRALEVRRAGDLRAF